MNLQEPFASPVRFTGPAEEFYPIVPVAGIFCCEDLFRATRQQHFFEFQRGVRSVGDLLLKVVREKYDGIDVVRLLFGRNETAVNQETMCSVSRDNSSQRRSLRISRRRRGVPEPKRNVTSASVAK